MALFTEHDSEFSKLDAQEYGSEDALQALLASRPELLSDALSEDEETPSKLMLVTREFGIADEPDGSARWSLDLLFLDDQGIPSLVEVRLKRNREIRRHVVGQIFEYAANLGQGGGVNAIRQAFEESAAAKGFDPDQQLFEQLGQSDTERFWGRVAANLGAGRMRLIFAADRIPAELQGVVEFLNERTTQIEVLAVEVRKYANDAGTKTFVSKVIGRTEAARQTKATTSGRIYRKHTEEQVRQAIIDNQPKEISDRVLDVYDFMRERADKAPLGSGAKPSIVFWMGEHPDREDCVGVRFDEDSVSIYFEYLQGRSVQERGELAKLARKIPGVSTRINDLEQKDWRIRPYVGINDVFVSDEAVEVFKRFLVAAVK